MATCKVLNSCTWPAAAVLDSSSGLPGCRVTEAGAGEWSHRVTSHKADCFQGFDQCSPLLTVLACLLRPHCLLGGVPGQGRGQKELGEDIEMSTQLSQTIWLPLPRSPC